jgi:serine/threonine protein kinase
MSTADARRWGELHALFDELADATPEARAARMTEIAARDADLALELRELLASDDDASASEALTHRLACAVNHLAAGLDDDAGRPAFIGDYRITGTLGTGGMGVVYLAEQESPRRTVALKVIRAFGGASAVRRFHREAELHGRLQHPGIALVHEAGMATERSAAGSAQGPMRPFFAMEYVHGEPVTAFAQRARLSIDERVELVAKICDAIEHAHSRGVIHRDLKSANVLVDDQGNPKVLDFGIARAVDRDQAATLQTAVGEVIGTLPYMSPEQVSGDPSAVGVHSDIYALGVVLFETLSGRRPLDLSGRTVPEAVRMVTDDEPTRLGTVDRTFRGDLETIVSRCLEKDPTRRYPSAGALAADLRRHLAHRPIEARPPSTYYQLSKFARRNRPLVLGVCMAFAALLAGTTVSIVMMVQARRAGEDLKVQLRAAEVEQARSSESFALLSNLIRAADPANSGGKDLTVRELLVRAADELEKESTASPEVRGMLGRIIGVTLRSLGDLPRAERTLRRSIVLLKMSDSNAVGRGKYMAETLANLGDILREQDKLDEAAEVLAEAIEVQRQFIRDAWAARGTPLPHDEVIVEPTIAVALNNLSLVHQTRGDLGAAEATAREAWQMEQKLVAAGYHRKDKAATALVNMASAQLLQGRSQEAEASFREAVATHEAISGPDAPITQTVRNNYASALRSNGKYAESAAIMRVVGETRARVLPEGHFERTLSDSRLAACYAAMGRYLKAIPLMDRPIASAEQRAGGDSEDSLILRMSRARWLAAIGRSDEARSETRSAMAAIERLRAPSMVRVGQALALEAAVLQEVGDCAGARAAAARALEIIIPLHGVAHPVALIARRADVLAMRDCEGAGSDAVVEAMRQLLADVVSKLGRDHPDAGLAQLMLAETMHAHMLTSSSHASDEELRRQAASYAKDAARTLARPGGLEPWYSQYAAVLAQVIEDPRTAESPEVRTAVANIELAIASVAGEHAEDLTRMRMLRPARLLADNPGE